MLEQYFKSKAKIIVYSNLENTVLYKTILLFFKKKDNMQSLHLPFKA